MEILFGYMARSRIAGSYGNCVFSFLRNLHPVLHSGSTTVAALRRLCSDFFFFFFFDLFLLFLGLLPWHMEVPRLGVESELQPPAYSRATATRDPSCVCNLRQSSRQRQILNPLSKGRGRTRNLMVPSRIR